MNVPVRYFPLFFFHRCWYTIPSIFSLYLISSLIVECIRTLLFRFFFYLRCRYTIPSILSYSLYPPLFVESTRMLLSPLLDIRPKKSKSHRGSLRTSPPMSSSTRKLWYCLWLCRLRSAPPHHLFYPNHCVTRLLMSNTLIWILNFWILIKRWRQTNKAKELGYHSDWRFFYVFFNHGIAFDDSFIARIINWN